MARIKSGATIDSIFLVFVRGVSIISTFIITKILSENLSLFDYGTYSQLNVIISVGASIISLGLADGINYFFNKSSDETRMTFVNTIFSFEIIAGIFLVVLLIAFRNSISIYFSNDVLKMLVFVIAIKPLFDNLIYYYQVLFVSIKKAKTIAIKNFIVTILRLVVVVILVKWQLSLFYLFLALVILDLMQILFFKFSFDHSGYKISLIPIKFDIIKEILSYSIPIGMFTIMSSLNRELDKLVIGYFSSTEVMAIYSNCSKLLPLDIIAISFTTVLIPYIMRYVSSRNYSEAATLYKNYLKIGYFSSWVIGFAILISPKTIIRILYSEVYVSGVVVFVLYIIDSMIKFSSLHLILTASRATKYLVGLSLICLVINLALNVLFYVFFGFVGPAIATLLVSIIYSVLLFIKTKKILDVPINQLIDVRGILLFGSTTLFVSILFNYISYKLIGYGFNDIVVTLSMALFYAILILILFRKSIFGSLREINSLRL